MLAVGVGMYLQEAWAQMGSVTRQPLARGNPGSNHPPACPLTKRRNPHPASFRHKPLGALEKLEEQERNPGGKAELNLQPRVSYFLLPSLPRGALVMLASGSLNVKVLPASLSPLQDNLFHHTFHSFSV